MRLGARLFLNVLLAVLLAGTLGGLYSCEKASLEPATADSSGFAALRKTFYSQGYDRQLAEPFGDTATLYWRPRWPAAYSKTDTKGVVYTYVPLTAKLRSNASLRWSKHFVMVGTRRFILIRQAEEGTRFSLASYIAATPQGQSVQAAAAQPVRFATFTGVMTLRGLSGNERARFVYANGMVVKPAATAGGKNSGAASYEVCHEYHTCYWSSSCNINGNYTTFGTTTNSTDNYCPEPGYEACPNNWGMTWTSVGEDINQQCYWVEDPPQPGDDDDGDGPGGDDDDDDDGEEDPLTPCQAMNELSQQWAFNAALTQLRSDVVNNPLEVGYTFLNGSDPSTFVRTVGNLEQISMSAAGRPVGGAIHTHPQGNDALPIFSPRDLQSIYNSMENLDIDPETYTYTVVLYNGVSYSLKIDDPVQFKAFGDAWLSNTSNLLLFGEVYYDEKTGGIGAPNSTIAGTEKSFLAMLGSNSGLTLFKHDQTTNTWPQMGLDANDNPAAVPCL